MTINGDVEKIIAKGEKAASGSVGIGAEAGNVIINGGTVEATGNEATTNGASNGIWAAGEMRQVRSISMEEVLLPTAARL